MKLEELDFDVIDWNEDDDEIEGQEEITTDEEEILSAKTIVIPPPYEIEEAMNYSFEETQEEESGMSAIAELAASLDADSSSNDGPVSTEEMNKDESMQPESVAGVSVAKEPKPAKSSVKKETSGAVKVKPATVQTKAKKSAPVKTAAKKSDAKKEAKKGGFRLSLMDAVIALVGLLVVAMVVVVLVFWRDNRNTMTDIGEFATVGSQLSDLKTIGKHGINRVVSMASEGIDAENVVTTADGEEILISVLFTSIEKDLKIKFVNQYTEKILTGTQFSMEAVAPDNEILTWTDEDADGVIYMENLAPGNYMVTIFPVGGYTFPTDATKVVVKDKITYTAINILDEVKSEKDINASKEDGDGQGSPEEEPKLTDTVEWVESTKVCVSGADGYAPIDKSKIPDPTTLSSGTGRISFLNKGTIMPMAVTDMGTSAISLQTGEATQLVPSSQDDTKYIIPYTYVWKVEGDAVKTTKAPDEKSMAVEAVKAGTALVTCTIVKEYADGSATKDEDVYKYQITVTEKAVAGAYVTELSLSSETLALKVGESTELKATVKGNGEFVKDIKTTVADTNIAKYEGGKVTALATGTTDITFTTVGLTLEGNTLSKTCKVTVSEAVTGDLKLTVSEKKKTILVEETYQIQAVVTNYLKDKGVTYVSSDEKIAKVNDKGVVTGIAKGGPVKITITTNEKGKDGKKLTEVVEITVKANIKADRKTPLKDASGNQIYIKGSDGKYVAAVWADYFTASTFYVEAEPVYKYTGWQTLNGKTYFFDKNGNKVTGQQVIQGVKYVFGSDGALSMNGGVLGIDVSKYQTEIDWKAVKNSGISFVIIRCGYRGYSTGVLVQDPMFESHIKGATAAGLKVGIYFFSQAVNEKEAVEEASMAVALARKYTVTYPIFIDTEQVAGGRANNLDASTRTAVCKAFCETVKGAGYTPGVYACKTWYEGKLSASTLEAYKIWLAQYASAPTYSGKYDMWQYTEKGKVNGVSGNVDMNLSYLGY